MSTNREDELTKNRVQCSLRKFISRTCWQLTGPDVGDGVTQLESKLTIACQGNTAGQSALRKTKMFIWFLNQANYTRHYPTYNNSLFGSKQDV